MVQDQFAVDGDVLDPDGQGLAVVERRAVGDPVRVEDDDVGRVACREQPAAGRKEFP